MKITQKQEGGPTEAIFIQGWALVLFCWSEDMLKCEKCITNTVGSDAVVISFTDLHTDRRVVSTIVEK